MIGDVLTIGGYELEIVFDGSHHGRDQDLLDASLRVPVKQCGVDVARRPNAARDVILGLLRTGARLTQHEICERSGLPMGTVNDVMSQLLQKGRVDRQDAGRTSATGRMLR